MKKIMKVLCVFALVFLAGCSSTNSQDEQKQVVTDFFTYVSKCDIKNLKKITSSSVLNDMELEKMEKELSQYTEEEYGKVFVEETDKFKKAIFKDLFTDIDYRLCGTANSLEDKLERVHTFYTIEQEKKYGILAIKIQLL